MSPSRAAAAAVELCHANLARGFRGGERQTELLVRALYGRVATQHVIVRRSAPLESRFADLPDVRVTGVRGRLGAVVAMRGAGLIHAHENGAAQAAFIRHWLSSTPYIITRRVDNMPKAVVTTQLMYQCAESTVVLSAAIDRVLEQLSPKIRRVRIPDASSDFPVDAAWVSEFRRAYPNKLIVGHVAAFDFSHKGQDTLLAAAALLERERSDLQFVLVGSGSDDALVERAAAELASVDVVGWVDNVGDYLAAFDMFVMPSVREGLGSVLLDAMQFGLPIVASRVGGIPDIVEDETNGLLVEASNAGALAAAISRLASDSNLRRVMSATNRERARTYSAAAMAEQYLRIYAKAVPGFPERRNGT